MKLINKLSIVVSVYNEEAVLDKFYETILPILEGIDSDYELIFVNDGSRDASPAILDRLAMDSKKVKVIHFSRNYGHEAAMIAGIDYSSGDGIVCMDAMGNCLSTTKKTNGAVSCRMYPADFRYV